MQVHGSVVLSLVLIVKHFFLRSHILRSLAIHVERRQRRRRRSSICARCTLCVHLRDELYYINIMLALKCCRVQCASPRRSHQPPKYWSPTIKKRVSAQGVEKMKGKRRVKKRQTRIITLGDKCAHTTKGYDREKIAARGHFLSQEYCARALNRDPTPSAVSPAPIVREIKAEKHSSQNRDSRLTWDPKYGTRKII